jgi:hypothetical protein
MANWDNLKAAIQDVIKENGNEEITGQVLQNTLLSIVNNLGENATFAGVASPATNPGTPDQNVFYIASEDGIYSNFNGIMLSSEVVIITNKNGEWEKIDTGIATSKSVEELVEYCSSFIEHEYLSQEDGYINKRTGAFVVYNQFNTITVSYEEGKRYFVSGTNGTGNNSCLVSFFNDDIFISSRGVGLGEIYEFVEIKNIPEGTTKIKTSSTKSSTVGYGIYYKAPLRNIVNEITKNIKYPYYIGSSSINMYNKDDLLYGRSLTYGNFIAKTNGIFSNKLFVRKGEYITTVGIKGFKLMPNDIFIAYFKGDDEFIKRDVIRMSDTTLQIATFMANYSCDYEYIRILIQDGTNGSEDLGVGGIENALIQYGKSASEFEEFAPSKRIKPYLIGDMKVEGEEESTTTKKTIFLIGASFAYSANTWFATMCNNGNYNGINKAVSGSAICDDANKMYNGTLYTPEQLENMDYFLIMHTHNKDVASEVGIKENYEEYITEYLEGNPGGTTPFNRDNYAVAYDYVIKKYMADCYNLKNEPTSKYYNTEMGKPCNIIFMTHWHDARTIFNDSIRILAAKWGIPLVELDKNIGFSKDNVHSVTLEQISTIFAQDNEIIDGVTYGWHPSREATTEGAYIQLRISNITLSKMKEIEFFE